jgi:hypothetical protein
MKKPLPLAILNRRDWGRAALGLALAPWSLSAQQALGSPDNAQPPVRWQNDPFALGVASGQPRADSAVLGTRLLCRTPTLPIKPGRFLYFARCLPMKPCANAWGSGRR